MFDTVTLLNKRQKDTADLRQGPAFTKKSLLRSNEAHSLHLLLSSMGMNIFE